MADLHPIKALSREIAADDDYAWAVFCNMAVPIMDAAHVDHQIANEAAAHLMQHLFEYDVTAHPLYEYGKSDAQKYAEFRIAMDRQEDAAIATRPAPPAMDREAGLLHFVQTIADMVGDELDANCSIELRDWARSILSTLSADVIRQGEGWRLVPVEPTHQMIRAAAESVAHDDEGAFEPVMDLLGFSGENKTHTVLRQLLIDAIAAAPASHASDGGKA